MKEFQSKKTDLNEGVYQVIRSVSSPMIKKVFNPIIINNSIIPKDEKSIVYAPNHRSTLDPFIIFSTTTDSIHWAALKRFFDAEDSIFNNSKNPILCYLTKYLFLSMGLIPIDRNSSNIDSLRLMNNLLKEKRNLGIFPEGTTNKHPELYDIGPVKPGLTAIARTNNAWILPISILWIEDEKIKNKVIINYRTPFLPSEMTKSEATDLWIKEVQSGIDENREIIKSLKKISSDKDLSILSLKIK